VFPILVIKDNAPVHRDWISEIYCENHKITNFYLLPHTSHIDQFHDVSIFGPLKKRWWTTFEGWADLHPRQSLPRDKLWTVLHKTWYEMMTREKALQGFVHIGLTVKDNGKVVDTSRVLERIQKSAEEIEPMTIDKDPSLLLAAYQQNNSALKKKKFCSAQRDQDTGLSGRKFASTNPATRWKIGSTSITDSESSVQVDGVDKTLAECIAE